jgi:LAS superfamily LD-carboxypeptidase LdcB
MTARSRIGRASRCARTSPSPSTAWRRRVRGEAGLFLSVTSGFRSDAEQAALFAADPDPKWVAPPGESLHRYATELDLGPQAAYAWLAANAPRFGFVMRYSWEPWH